MLIERQHLATEQETLEVFCKILLQHNALHHVLRNIMRGCASKKHHVSIEQSTILLHLYHRQERHCLYISHILLHNLYSGLNPSYTLNKLCKTGLIEKTIYDADKRKTQLSLSVQGAALAREIHDQLSRRLHRRLGLFESLGRCVETIETVIRLLP
jgi:DNA-binding MarR family transcriptional regulator